MKNILSICILSILLIGCGPSAQERYNSVKEVEKPIVFQRTSIHQTPNPPREKSTSEVLAKGKEIFNQRQEWIEKNLWMTKKEMVTESSMQFILVNKSAGTLKSYIIMYYLFDDEHRELASGFIYKNTTIFPDSSSQEWVSIDSDFTKVASGYSFKIVGMSVDGVTLPGD
jgi:hypothetical protein